MMPFQQQERQHLFAWPNLMILFILFAFAGFLYEEALFIVYGDPIEKRGFLFGPWLPIYGIGGVLITALLCRYLPRSITIKKINLTPYIVFIVMAVLATLIELIAGLILTQGFNLTLWDYSARRFNFLGMIALWPSCRFGFGGLVMYYLLLPLADWLTKRTPPLTAKLLGIIFCIDLVFSLGSYLLSYF